MNIIFKSWKKKSIWRIRSTWLYKFSGFNDSNADNFQEWLECDVGGNQVLTDYEFLSTLSLAGRICISFTRSCPLEDFSDAEQVESGPFTEEAFRCLKADLKWMEQQ